MPPPILIAHRGASGHMPEHTLAAYALAIVQGADYIEPDLVATRDGVLVARHENEISGTTDVAAHAGFAARLRTQCIDGVQLTGWFTEDFTLAELKTLRARERIPDLRPCNVRFDGQLEIPTFAEILALLSEINATRVLAGRAPVGVYPETKHPSHFAAMGLALEPPLLEALRATPANAPVFIQSFETGNLQWLRERCAHPLVQLMSVDGGPWDLRSTTYAGMAQPEGLARIAGYADAIGVQKDMVVHPGAETFAPTPLVAHAHAAGLAVHAWTFRAENAFLPEGLRRGVSPASHGRMDEEIRIHVGAGVDGLFCDFPDLGRAALDSAKTAPGNGTVKNL